MLASLMPPSSWFSISLLLVLERSWPLAWAIVQEVQLESASFKSSFLRLLLDGYGQSAGVSNFVNMSCPEIRKLQLQLREVLVRKHLCRSSATPSCVSTANVVEDRFTGMQDSKPQHVFLNYRTKYTCNILHSTSPTCSWRKANENYI